MGMAVHNLNRNLNFFFKAFLVFLSFFIFSQVNAQDTLVSKIVKVFDGDTFLLETGEKVRMIGIDTPEKWESNKLDRDAFEHFKDKETIKKLGELSSVYTETLLNNQVVVLITDPINSNKDRYGRLLRYVYLEDGTFYNLKIIQDGYAYAYTRFPATYLNEFVNAEQEAKLNKRGLWTDPDFSDMGD